MIIIMRINTNITSTDSHSVSTTKIDNTYEMLPQENKWNEAESHSIKTVISLKQQLHWKKKEVRLKKNATFQEFKNQLNVEQLQRKHKNADPFPPGACLISGDSILNGIRKGNLSKEQTGKSKKISRSHSWRYTAPCFTDYSEKAKIYDYPCWHKSFMIQLKKDLQ